MRAAPKADEVNSQNIDAFEAAASSTKDFERRRRSNRSLAVRAYIKETAAIMKPSNDDPTVSIISAAFL